MIGEPASASGAPARPGSLAGHSVIYLVGTALQGVGVLLILPFATRLLGDAEFGRVTTALVIVQMVGTLAAAGLPQVILREYHRGEDGPTAGRALAGTMALLAAAVAVLGIALGAGLAAAGLVELRQWSLVVAASAALTVVVAGQTLSRARIRPVQFLVLAVLSTVVAHLSGLLAAQADGSSATYLTAYVVALLVAALAALAIGRPLLPTRAPARTRAGLRLAAPLAPQAAAMLGLLMGDVLLVNAFLGSAAAGNYQVALQLGNMPFVLSVALFNAWSPLVLSHPRDTRWEWTARTGTAMTGVVALGSAGVALLGPWLIRLVAPADFDQAAMTRALGFITIVAIAYMTYQGSSLAVLDHERTGRLAAAAGVALVILVLVSWALAGRLGIDGVAVAKATAYVVLLGMTWHAATTLSRLRWPPALRLVALGGAMFALLGALLPDSGPGAAVRLVLTGALGLLGLALMPRVVRSLRG